MVKATKTKSSNNSDENDPETVLLDYLQTQNRPFGVNDIFQNLHGTIGKTAITKLLTTMADKGKITSKTFGKSVIYFPNQSESEALSEEASEQLDKEIEEAKLELESLKAKVQAQQKIVQTLKSSYTTKELHERIALLQTENEKYNTRLSKLDEGNEKVDPMARQQLEETLKRYKTIWLQKKRLVKEGVNLITEHIDKKPKEFMEELGIETDEMMGCDPTTLLDYKRIVLSE